MKYRRTPSLLLSRWLFISYGVLLLIVGALAGAALIIFDIDLSRVFAADSPWTQTDWSGGTTSGTVTGTVATYESASDVDTSTSGQVSLASTGTYAVVKGTQLSTGATDLHVGTKTALQYNTSQTYDDAVYSYSGGTPTRLSVDVDGDYVISLSLPFSTNGGIDSANRDALEAEVRVNGTKLDGGVLRASYIRNYDGHNESSINGALLAQGLSSGDYVEVYVARTAASSGHTYTSPGFQLYMEQVPSSDVVFSGTATRTVSSTNLNTSASSLQWTEVRNDSGITHDDVTDSHEITLDEAADYFVSINVPYSSSVQRANVEGQVLLDASLVDGGEFKQGYIRNASSHVLASSHWTGVVSTSTTNQVLTITQAIEGAAGTVTVGTDVATVYVHKLPTTGVYFGEAAQVAGSTNWNPTSASDVNWATDEIIDTDTYTHSTSSNNHLVTVDEDGDYLVGFNAALYSTAARSAPAFTVQVNGGDVTGMVTQSTYIRAGSGHNESSTTLLAPLLSLSGGDTIGITAAQTGQAGTVTATTPGLLFIKKIGYASSGTLVSNIFDAELSTDWGTLTYSTSGSGSVAVKVRTDSNSDMSGATDWASCTAISSGQDISSNGCVDDQDQYLQYQVTLTASGGSTPVFEDISITHSPSDQVAPITNASAILMSVSNGGASVLSNGWTNGAGPYFSWTAGADDGGGSGVKGYCLYLGTDSDGDPETAKGLLGTSPVSTSGSTCQFIVSGTSVDFATAQYIGTPLSSSTSPYYLNIKVIDNGNNVFSGSSAQFQFRFDNTKPTNPSFISLPSDFISTKAATMTWPSSGGDAAADAHSGVAGLQYRIGTSGTWYGDSHNGAEDSTDLLADDGSYTTIETPDYDNIVEGNNLIYLRTWDNAGNASTSYTSGVLKVNSTSPSAPENLTVTPDDAVTNAYSFAWDVPTSFTGTAENLTYCYTINAVPSLTACSYTSAGQTSLSEGAYATQPGENTLYLVAKDEAGNVNYDTYSSIAFTYSGTAPGVPANPDVADISVKSTENWKLTISWEEPTDVGAGVSEYTIYRSDSDASCTSSFGSFSELGSTSGTAYSDTGLLQQNYYYCVKACDSANNCGAPSTTVTGYPDGRFLVAASLTAEPVVSNITTKKATITWSTDRTADSKVAFGTSCDSFYDEEPSNSTQTTSHTIVLDNLDPGNEYCYSTKWTDEDGNTGVSPELTFSTLPAPVVTDPSVSNIGINSASITFTVSGASSAKVYYGPSTTFGGLSDVATSTNETTYTINLTGLTDDTKYFYKINTFDTEQDEYEGSTLSFTTLPRPRISNVRVQEVSRAVNPTVLVTWDTNTEISSIVTVYPEGNPAAARDVVNVARISGEHKMVVEGLSTNTNYLLLVKGRDVIGNEAVSDSQRFTTATDTRPPQVSDLTVEGSSTKAGDTSTVQLIVSWNTDEPATSQVEFGEGSGTTYAQKTQQDSNLTFNHVVIISGLTPSKVYHLRAISTDSAGNEGHSIDTVTIAPRSTDNALNLVLSNLQEAFGFIQVGR